MHSSTPAWRTPWTERPGGHIQSMGLQGWGTTEPLGAQARFGASLPGCEAWLSRSPVSCPWAIIVLTQPRCQWGVNFIK